jgi:predicted GNAT family acetyltransferase
MELRRFDDPAAFFDHARPFLLAHEAHHVLMLSICARLIAAPEAFTDAPYLATVDADGMAVAAAVMTPPHNVVLSLAVPDALPLIAADLHTRYGTLPGVHGRRDISRAFAERWQEVSGHPFRPGRAMRIYQLTRAIPVTGVAGRFRSATAADRDLLIAWMEAFGGETGTGGDARRSVEARLSDPERALYLWEDGLPVSMAAQDGATPNGIRVNAVYTPPEYRRRGYASACVAALSQHLLDHGYRFCALYADLANPTSNHVYQAIGYEPVCDASNDTILPLASP